MNGPFGFGGTAVADAPTADDEHNASLVAQLAALYQEKQELQTALGASTAEEIIALIQAKQNESMLGSLTQQLAALYAEHDELNEALGVTTSAEIISLVKELRSSIRTLVDDTRRRLAYEASILETHERYLA